MSFKKKQLMDNRSEQSGDEMDDGDAGKMRSCGWKRVSHKEKDDMTAFLVENFREHENMTSLSKKYAEVQGTGIPFERCRGRFRRNLVPNIHEIDCSVETKLEIYQKYQIKVNEEYIEELKRHAHVTFNKGPIVVEFKMKDDNEEVEEAVDDDTVNGQMAGSSSRPKRTRDRAAEASSAKKARKEDLIVDRVVPGTGIQIPEMIIVVPKTENLVNELMGGGTPEYEQEADRSLHDEPMNMNGGDTPQNEDEKAPIVAAGALLNPVDRREHVENENMNVNEDNGVECLEHVQRPQEIKVEDQLVTRMENRLMAEMRNTMNAAEKRINENLKKQIADMAMASDRKIETAVKDLEAKVNSLQEELKSIRESSVASNSLIVGSVEESAALPDTRAECFGQLQIGQLVNAMKEVVTRINDAIKTISEKSGSQSSNPHQAGPSEPNPKLKDYLEHLKEWISSRDTSGMEHIQKNVEAIIEKCNGLDPNIEQESLRLLLKMFLKITEK